MSENNDNVEILETEKELVLDHDYDGIKELDHPLPLWWVFIFGLTIAFSVPYYFYYVHGGGPDNRAELNEELARIHKIQDDYEAKAGGFNVEAYNQFVVTEEGQKLGKKVFKRKCAACHAPEGQGSIGPNLTDNYWIHGDGKLASVYKTVANGVTDKGMPSWKTMMNEKELMAVTAYVLKFKGHFVEGKEPQGQLINE